MCHALGSLGHFATPACAAQRWATAITALAGEAGLCLKGTAIAILSRKRETGKPLPRNGLKHPNDAAIAEYFGIFWQFLCGMKVCIYAAVQKQHPFGLEFPILNSIPTTYWADGCPIWRSRAPPGDFGGNALGQHGMALAAEPLSLSVETE